jgi:anti-anti-sigma factor
MGKMKYQIMEEDECLLIKVSGKTRKNEAVLSNALLKPYLQDKGVKVIFDLKELEKFDPMTLLGVLNTLRKEIDLLRGDLMVCSLKPAMEDCLRENRLDHIFNIFEDTEKAKRSLRSDYGK